ncbi:hypothetical protein IscW_ISCW019190, partial [Ixodes scapularis]
ETGEAARTRQARPHDHPPPSDDNNRPQPVIPLSQYPRLHKDSDQLPAIHASRDKTRAKSNTRLPRRGSVSFRRDSTLFFSLNASQTGREKANQRIVSVAARRCARLVVRGRAPAMKSSSPSNAAP